MSSLIAMCFLLCCLSSRAQEIRRLSDMQQAITDGPNRKVGFEKYYMYPILVGHVLPDEIEVVVCDGKPYYGVICNNVTHLDHLVKEGILLAGCMILYSDDMHKRYHIFSSSIATPYAFVTKPDISADGLYGLEKSSRDLIQALNAAIVRVQNKGYIPKKRELSNMYLLSTCKTKDYKSLPIPNKTNATGLLREVLDSKVLNAVTYSLDSFDAILQLVGVEFGKLSGPDGEIYGEDIVIQNIAPKFTTHQYRIKYVLDGRAHFSASPLPRDFPGSLKICQNDTDCILDLQEVCETTTESGSTTDTSSGICKRPILAYIDMFSTSMTCTVYGYTQRFFSRRATILEDSTDASPTYSMMWMAMFIPTAGALLLITVLARVIHLQRKATT